MLDPKKIGLKVGLEIHQQMATNHKLFCKCPSGAVGADYSTSFQRRLRPTQSELGEFDPASLYEFIRGYVYRYNAPMAGSCLVEADEEPPRDLNREALEYALKIALMLEAEPVDEIHVMRKVVIDGSNTTGFQRTAVAAFGGKIGAEGTIVPIQSITIEEDACRLIEQGENRKEFSLQRLGVPLIEVSLAPVTASPKEVAKIALSLGRLMRATRLVARGLGTIRQDANVSVRGGPVVEVKGIQELDKLESIIEFEALRQEWLNDLARELKARGLTDEALPRSATDASQLFSKSKSKMVARSLSAGGVVFVIPLPKMKGLLAQEPYEGVRLGADLADRAKAHGLGGIIHSDELPAWGIEQKDVDNINSLLHLTEQDAFALLFGSKDKVEEASTSIIERLGFLSEGVPAETRGPAADAKTRYMRPRPGAARMYPETDIPPVPLSPDYIEKLKNELPLGWNEQIKDLTETLRLSRQLAEQIQDSDLLPLFETVTISRKLPPTFVASLLTEGVVTLRREGLPTNSLDERTLLDLFQFIEEGKVAKEASLDILRTILKGQVKTVSEAMEVLDLHLLTEAELQRIVDEIISANASLIKEKGEKAAGPIMGEVMAKVRGRINGSTVNSVVNKKVKEALQS